MSHFPGRIVDRFGSPFSSHFPIVRAAAGGGGNGFDDDFETGATLDPAKWETFQPLATGGVTLVDGRYINLVNDGGSNDSLWFGTDQGRYDYQDPESLTFEFIAYNCGIGQVGNPTTPPAFVSNQFKLCGILVHVADLNTVSYRGMFVGHRGSQQFTVEMKNTNNGVSNVRDEGPDVAPTGRLDLSVVGNGDGTVTFRYRAAGSGPDNWTIATPPIAQDPGAFTTGLHVGLVAYKFTGFAGDIEGVCDGWEKAA